MSSNNNNMRNNSINNTANNLMKKGKAAGFITYQELNDSIQANNDLSIEDLEKEITKFSEAGIDIIEDDDVEAEIRQDLEIDESFTGRIAVAEPEEKEAEEAAAKAEEQKIEEQKASEAKKADKP